MRADAIMPKPGYNSRTGRLRCPIAARTSASMLMHCLLTEFDRCIAASVKFASLTSLRSGVRGLPQPGALIDLAWLLEEGGKAEGRDGCAGSQVLPENGESFSKYLVDVLLPASPLLRWLGQRD